MLTYKFGSVYCGEKHVMMVCLHCGKVGNLEYCFCVSATEAEPHRIPASQHEVAAYALGGRDAVLALLIGDPWP